MKMKKQMIAFLLCVLILCSLLAGCMKNEEAVNLAEDIHLGSDGIVTAQTLSELHRSGNIVSVYGKSGDYEYKWTVSGADITQERDICMALEISAGEAGAVSIKLKSTRAFGFLPTLSVALPEKWEAQSAGVYASDGERLCEAALTGTDNTTLTFKLIDGVFEYTVRADAASPETASPDVKLSDGSRTERDKYGTDPVPEGKPEPVEPENSGVDTEKRLHCTVSIDCTTILNNIENLDPAKLDVLPRDGIILGAVTVEFYEGESVFDLLQRVCRERGIHLEASFTPGYNSAYVEGIHNLYEFDCGETSGWMYSVNGWFPNYGCSRYVLHDGDVVRWRYTCDLGADVGGGMQ